MTACLWFFQWISLISLVFLVACGGGDEGSSSNDSNGDNDAAEIEEEALPSPTYWTAQATKIIDDIEFIEVDGKPFFGIGFHGSQGLIWDGVTTEGCDKDAGVGYLPSETNIEKTQAAYEAGANFIYMWSFKSDLITPERRFYGQFHEGYGVDRPVEEDIIPIIYNRYGEVELEGYNPDKADEMREEFEHFINRTGPYSLENLPNLPPVEQVGYMSWHPTFRMNGTGDGSGEMLTSEQADDLAQTTNMMIGDTYNYVANRYDMNDPLEYAIGVLSGQKGDKGEDYEYWLETDDPDHRSYFNSGFNLSYSLTRRRLPGSVVWMWLQGYSFGDGITRTICEGDVTDAWAAGGFPPLTYYEKEILSMVVNGSTGIIYFGFGSNRWPETEILLQTFRVLSHSEIYEPVLLSPRLDLGYDTLFMGEEGYDGKGRAHLMVKWYEEGKTAYVIGANPGARATTVTMEFPWTLEEAQRFDWEELAFIPVDRVKVWDKTLTLEFLRDEGMIVKVTPKMLE